MDTKNNPQVESDEDNILSFLDFKKLLSDVIRFWWLFVISVAVVFIGLKIYHRYKPIVYSAEASIIIDVDGKSSQRADITQGIMLGGSMRNFDNQLAILSSRSLTANVVNDMGIFVSYYNEGRIKTDELYNNSNFLLIMDSTHVQPLGAKIYITPKDQNTFTISVNAKKVDLYNYHNHELVGRIENINFDDTFLYGQPIVTPWCAFTIICQKPIENRVFAVFNDPDNLVDRFVSALSISNDKKSESSVVTLSMVGTCRQKNIDYLNTLIKWYINDNLHQKNEMSENTIHFIEGQLSVLQDTLSNVEIELSHFRSQNGIQDDLSKKGVDLLSDIKDYDKELKQLQLESSYYEYLERYFSNDSVMKGDIAPATFKTERPVISELLNNILDLNSKKQIYRDTYGKDGNPMYDALNAELNIARNTLLTSIKSHKKMVQDNIAEVNAKLEGFNYEVTQLPEKERRLLGIDRKFTLNNEVFNFLMRKRAEAQIQRASNTSDHKILDAAETTGVVSPKTKRDQAMGIAVAFIVPLLFLVLRQLIDRRVRTLNDVNKVTNLPVIGEIPNSKKDTPHVVYEYPRSNISEEFRRIRIKLDFMAKGKHPAVFCVTSSMPSEGKTFCSLNIATVFAIANKKTLLLGFDLRRPGLSKLLGLKNHAGISDYLIGNCSLEEAISNYNGMDVIGSGTIPPNPSELIMSDACAKMMETLKSIYDVIIIDTPPVGPVSDVFLLTRWSDANVFIVRQDYTFKEAFKEALESINDNQLTNVGIVVNDINNSKTRYGYGYGYGSYGHGSKYGKYGYNGYDDEQTYGGYVDE